MDRAWARLMNHRRWSFNDTTLAVNFQANVQTYALPADLRFFDGVRFNTFADPQFLPYQQFRDYVGVSVATGTPTHYTRRGNNLIFYPTPDAIVAGQVDYNKRPTKPSAAAAADLGVPDVMCELLVLGTVRLMAMRERDMETRAGVEQDYNALLQEFMAEHGMEQRQDSQRVVRTGVHDAYNVDVWPYG